jgi:hypothetical protein
VIPYISIQVEKLRQGHNKVFTSGDTDQDGFLSPAEFFEVSFQFQIVIRKAEWFKPRFFMINLYTGAKARRPVA